MAVITPESFVPFVQEELVIKKNMLNFGVVEQDTSSVVPSLLQKGGDYVTKLFNENLQTIANAQKITATTTLTPTTTAHLQEAMVVVHRGDSYYDTEYQNTVSGLQQLKMLSTQITPIVLETIQTSLANVTKGAFASGGPLYSTHRYDWTTKEDGYMSAKALVTASQSILGEDLDTLDTLIVHSQVFADMENSIISVPASDLGGKVLYQGLIPTYNGKRVLVNDTLCAATSSVYPSYLSAGTPWYLTYQRNYRVLTDMDILYGGGENKIAWYVDYVPHLKGIHYGGSANPAESDLYTGTNWSKIYETRNIKLVRVETYGGK